MIGADPGFLGEPLARNKPQTQIGVRIPRSVPLLILPHHHAIAHATFMRHVGIARQVRLTLCIPIALCLEDLVKRTNVLESVVEVLVRMTRACPRPIAATLGLVGRAEPFKANRAHLHLI